MFTITAHAVERFIERCAPGTSMATARARLEVHAATAARLRQKTPSGDQVYLAEGLCRMIVRKSQFGEVGGVVVTVLPLEEEAELEATPEFVIEEAMRLLLAFTDWDARAKAVAQLDREHILTLKAETAKRAHAAEKTEIQGLNALSACLNAELRARPDDRRDLRRALGKMLFKYGWVGNEPEHEVYQRIKHSAADD